MAPRETPLTGGRITEGVVRVGDTVRRPASPFTAILLPHLASAGFDGAPRYLGQDERGREILTFLPGAVSRWVAFTDSQIADVAILLRGLHDASRDLAARLGGDVVCHHDAAPNNTIFRAGRPVAFIDFDFAAPGDPLVDLAYVAWSWCISSKPERAPVTGQAYQVRVLADAYGLTAEQRQRLPDAVADRLAYNEMFWQERPRGWTGPEPAEIVAWTRREAAHVERHRDIFAAAML